MNAFEPYVRLLFTPPSELIKGLQRKEFGINFDIKADEQKFAQVVLFYLDSSSLELLTGLMNELCLNNDSNYSIFFKNCLFWVVEQADEWQKTEVKRFFQEQVFCIDPDYLFDVCSKLELVVYKDQLRDYAVYLGMCKQFRKLTRLIRDFGIIVWGI